MEVPKSAAYPAQSPLVRALLHVKWASLLQKAGKYDRAEEHFGQSLALLPSARAHFGRGTCLAALRRREEALEELSEAVAMCPTMVGAIINLAGVQLGLGRFDEAERNCREALRLEPESREAVMNLANAMRNLGRRREAVELVWRHIGEAVDGVDVAQLAQVAQETVKTEKLVIACLKWGHRYSADYVNRLMASARRHLPSAHLAEAQFVCFTEDPNGIDEFIETRSLPDGFHLWWGKAFLFSAEAGLDGHRVLFLDLDQVIVGSLEPLLAYRGPFAVLHTDDIACELAPGGYNSSVLSWRGAEVLRPLFEALTPAVLRYVHRFDHWLEMMLGTTADVWQQLAPGAVVDYTTVFRGGRCLGCDDDGDDGAFAAGEDNGTATATEVALPAAAAVVTFPRSPKPHEVLEKHQWIREHWRC